MNILHRFILAVFIYLEQICKLFSPDLSCKFVCLQLGPNVTIGRNVVIHEGVRVRESIILEGAVVQVKTFTMGSSMKLLYVDININICSIELK